MKGTKEYARRQSATPGHWLGIGRLTEEGVGLRNPHSQGETQKWKLLLRVFILDSLPDKAINARGDTGALVLAAAARGRVRRRVNSGRSSV
ncbi:hypothetical protein EVAR_99194_1 [Eumeta japonica]|uniref:Uncharacterized protein n=1 Tax=Eumeta variegata TaxID=151549 RepID=A0A4C1YSJ2_EUMVA|nr:hypothetical protein EVAR_99194_1 [Eumeta japonica]